MNDSLGKQRKVLVTGVSGFIGRALWSKLSEHEKIVPVALVRKDLCRTDMDQVVVADLSSESAFSNSLPSGVDTVIHLAGRAHLVSDKADDPLAEFRQINVKGTMILARKAHEAGVKRFIFLSSIGVNGAETFGEAFSEESQPMPYNAYTLSKYEAEQELREFATRTGMEVVIIRPPMVYGADAPGNFGYLLKAVNKNFPLPLSGIKNRRSFIARENLVDFIMICIFHPSIGNQTFLVSDGTPISTSDLIKVLIDGMKKKNTLFYLPKFLLKLGARIFNKELMYKQLVGSLEIDIKKARTLLSWEPKVSTKIALKKAAEEFSTINRPEK